MIMNFSTATSSSSSSPKLGKHDSSERFCMICGHNATDQMEYEQHLLTHFQSPESLANAINGSNGAQKLLPYGGIPFLQMKNLLNQSQSSPPPPSTLSLMDPPLQVQYHHQQQYNNSNNPHCLVV
ncbi:hypothetical protein BLA29_003941 [Euroglyphus maynei]|uniref:Uncharacterized protein n=1 Tax=Euroglyphus maynei TaxID=6958 RepID=A0A1Y3BT20_EURMA|nr:hypothetical protein BLA29_003941 [Euroglyphus maynei]